MKICPLCNLDKEIEDFYQLKDSIQYACKSCINKRRYSNRKRNPLEYQKSKVSSKVSRILRIQELRERISKIKLEQGCCLCQYNKFASSLLFHHVDPSCKERNVSSLINRGKIKKTEEELKKCVVLCFNCHFLFHSKILTIPQNARRALD